LQLGHADQTKHDLLAFLLIERVTTCPC
jgi:hypothetical protein